MTTDPLPKKLEEIKLLMQYAVEPAELAAASRLVEKHAADSVGLNVFHNFYSFLPEGLEDAIHLLRLLARKQGAFLVCATTNQDDYLYLATSEKAEFLGPLHQGVWEEEVLDFFGFAGREAFIKAHSDLDKFPVYVPALLQNDLCPVCQAADGELHTLGCPVEICPWCNGQLTSCNCRFSVLDAPRLHKEKELEDLLAKLNKKGRVPFNAEEHRPGYLLTPEDLKTED